MFSFSVYWQSQLRFWSSNLLLSMPPRLKHRSPFGLCSCNIFQDGNELARVCCARPLIVFSRAAVRKTTAVRQNGQIHLCSSSLLLPGSLFSPHLSELNWFSDGSEECQGQKRSDSFWRKQAVRSTSVFCSANIQRASQLLKAVPIEKKKRCTKIH